MAALGASPLNASASTTFNVPCGNIKLLETAVGTPGSTVNLAKGCKYQLTHFFLDPYGDHNELPIVTGSVTINGHGATLLGISPPSPTCCGRILEVGTSGSPGYLTLNSVTITHGFYISVGGGAGGGLKVNFGSTAILNGSVVKNNSSRCNCSGGGSVGGGIANYGTLKLNGSRVLGNFADFSGAGIWSNGTLIITNHSQVNGNIANQGGGIYAQGTTTISDSSVNGNKAVDDGYGDGGIGGGIFFLGGGTLSLLNAGIIANSVSDLGTGDPSEGGGIAVFSASVVIDQSLIRNNIASSLGSVYNYGGEGGGLYNNGGTVSFVGGAVEFNAATSGGRTDGGGVFNVSGTVTQTGTTVTSNIPDDWS